jgi:5-methyltetrahydropteroyltriglutamate--homocysteine methyltransferase
MCAEEYVYLRAKTKTPAKVTLLSTQQAAAYYDPQRSAVAYPTRDAYLADVVDLTRREIAELVRLGCTYVQIDAPQYAALLDPEIREGYRQRGSDVDEMIDRTIELDNAVIGGFAQRGITTALHICRGNNQSMFYASGGYDPIAERVFRKTGFDRFLLEYDDERSGTFEPLRFVPEDRVVVLGLVTTKKQRVETREALEARVRAAAEVVPLERLALSPQCGFASTWEGNRITPDQQRAKLEIVAETAKAIWG